MSGSSSSGAPSGQDPNTPPSASTWDYFGQFSNYQNWQDSIVSQYGGSDSGTFQYSAVRFFAENLIPFLQLLNTVFFAIGFVFIIMAVIRLKNHGHSGMGKNVAPMATGFYFLSGIILMNYAPVVTALSNSLFNYSATDLSSYAGSLQNSDSLLYYVKQINAAGNNQSLILQQVTFGLLMIVGVISFARGLMILVHVGEGGGQENGIGKAFTHIFAGLVGINGLAFWKLMNSIVPLQGSTA